MSMERNIDHRRLSKHDYISTYNAHKFNPLWCCYEFSLLHSHRNGCSAMFSNGTSGNILKWGVATPPKFHTAQLNLD
jgi:hypothetical protein